MCNAGSNGLDPMRQSNAMLGLEVWKEIAGSMQNDRGGAQRSKNLPSPPAWKSHQHRKIKMHTLHLLRHKVRLQRVPTSKERRLPKWQQLS